MSAQEEATLMRKIPAYIDLNRTMMLMQSNNESGNYLDALNKTTSLGDVEISKWFHIKPNQLTKYKRNKSELPEYMRENSIYILSLFKHGKKVFGTTNKFMQWLKTENFYFDKKAPIELLSTSSGKMIVDNSLTAMEYGDNV